MSLHRLRDPEAAKCPIRDVLGRLGDRWTVLVLDELRQEPALRFSQIAGRIPDISERMLAQTLRHLEEDGLVSRTVYPTVPQRVDYALTPLGRSLIGPLSGMIGWAADNHDAVRKAREAYAEGQPKSA
jgi:DNA-binding HxlR family transcriptional regulator